MESISNDMHGMGGALNNSKRGVVEYYGTKGKALGLVLDCWKGAHSLGNAAIRPG